MIGRSSPKLSDPTIILEGDFAAITVTYKYRNPPRSGASCLASCMEKYTLETRAEFEPLNLDPLGKGLFQSPLEFLLHLSFMLLDIIITTSWIDTFYVKLHLELYIRCNLKSYHPHDGPLLIPF